MKWLPFILSILVFSVSLAPCSDDCSTDQNHGVESHAHNNDHTHNDDIPDDTCSPLCTCHCCHTTTIIIQNIQLSSAITSVNFFIDKNTSKPLREIHSIWHPPQA